MSKEKKPKPKMFVTERDGIVFTGPTAAQLRESLNEQFREEREFKRDFAPKAILRKKSGEVRELKPARVTEAMNGAGW